MVEDHNNEALNAFLGDKMKFYSSTRVEPYASTAERQENPVRENMKLYMSKSSVPQECRLTNWYLQTGALLMVIHNIVHPKIVNRKLFGLKRPNGRELYVEAVDGYGTELFVQNGTQFQINFHGVKINSMKFPVRLAFVGKSHKEHGHTFSNAVVDHR